MVSHSELEPSDEDPSLFESPLPLLRKCTPQPEFQAPPGRVSDTGISKTCRTHRWLLIKIQSQAQQEQRAYLE